jgi:ribosomal protein S18 acetylase RimI-like enzyme
LRSTTLDTLHPQTRADAFNAVYEGYLLPMTVPMEWMEQHVQTNDIALARSPLWLDDAGAVAGLALLGVRGDYGWVGGFGIAPPHRGRGLSHALARATIGAARSAGVRLLQLEVLKRNAPAIRVYERAGFSHRRDLLILRRSPDAPIVDVDTSVVQPADLPALLDARRRMAAPEPPWQRDPAGVARAANVRALAIGAPEAPLALAFYRDTERGLRLLDAAAVDIPAAQALLAALAERDQGHELTLVNEPEDSALLPALFDAGWIEIMRQHEMVLDLATAGLLT